MYTLVPPIAQYVVCRMSDGITVRYELFLVPFAVPYNHFLFVVERYDV